MDQLALPLLPLVGAGAGWTLSFWFAWLMYRGQVVSRAVLDDMRTLLEVRNAEERERSENYRAALDSEREITRELVDQVKLLGEQGEVMVRFVEHFPREGK